MKSMSMPQVNRETTLRDLSLAPVQPDFQCARPASPPHPGSEPRDASLVLFRDLRKYAGRLLIESPTDHPGSNEAALICQILFLKFAEDYITPAMCLPLLDEAAGAHVSPSCFYRERLAPRLKSWFGSAPHPAGVDSNQLFELTADILSHYTFTLAPPKSDNGPAPVAPWILAYIYERWINQRATGAYFTPDLLAENIVHHALQEWFTIQFEGHDLENVPLTLLRWHQAGQHLNPSQIKSINWIHQRLRALRLIDMSVGGGAFLVAASRILMQLYAAIHAIQGRQDRPERHRKWLAHIFANTLHGLDIAPQALLIARLRLWLLGFEFNAVETQEAVTFPPLPNLSVGDALAWTPHQKAPIELHLFEAVPSLTRQGNLGIPPHPDFDLCVGNPPFIALSQRNSVKTKSEAIRIWNTSHPTHPIKTTSDLSNLFILKGTDLLGPKGILAYITSRNFVDTNYGAPIRRYLTHEVELRTIFTLHDHPFTQEGIKVKANTIILSVARRKPQGPVLFQHLMSWRQPLSPDNTRRIDRTILQASDNWTRTLFANPLRDMITARCKSRIGDFAPVRMGVKSGCNTFFLLESNSDEARSLHRCPDALTAVVKNSRDISGFVLPPETQHYYLNLNHEVQGISAGYAGATLLPLADYIYQHGIRYVCQTCQSLAAVEHRSKPDRFPHAGMCERCPECTNGHQRCDRPVDRLSTQGHRPAWYTLSLTKPPLIAVQCIVDTEIGVFLNQHQVFVTDQFQVVEAPDSGEIGELLFVYLNSRIAHLLLEGSGLHRARFDGSFMLKIQVEHLRELPCPNFNSLTARHKHRLLKLQDQLATVRSRKSPEVEAIRDETDCVFLDILGYHAGEIASLQPRLRTSLEEAIRFRWIKTRMREADTA